MKALMYCDALVGCGTHDKCEVCWMVALSDKLETSLYQDDMETIFKFAGKTPKITYEETFDAEEA